MSNLQIITKSDYRNLGDLTTDQNFINLCSEIAASDVDVNRELTRLAMVSQKTKLWNCSINSIRAGVAMALAYGLEINGPAQHCFLIPYGDDAQFQLGYYGLGMLAKRIPRVFHVESGVVREAEANNKELFDYARGSSPFVVFKPNIWIEDRGAVVGAYSLIQIYNGPTMPMTQHVRSMNLADLNARREMSQAYRFAEYKTNNPKSGKKDSIWHTWPEPMYEKTIGKDGLKRCHDLWAMVGQEQMHLRSAMEIDNKSEQIDYTALGKILEPALIRGIQEGTEQPPMLEDQVSSEPYSAPASQAVPNIPEKPKRAFKIGVANGEMIIWTNYESIIEWRDAFRQIVASNKKDRSMMESLLETNKDVMNVYAKDEDNEIRQTAKQVLSGIKKMIKGLQSEEVDAEMSPEPPPQWVEVAFPEDAKEIREHIAETQGQTAEDAEGLFSEADKLAGDAINLGKEDHGAAKSALEQAYAVAEAIDSKLYPEIRKNALESCNAANEVINNGK